MSLIAFQGQGGAGGGGGGGGGGGAGGGGGGGVVWEVSGRSLSLFKGGLLRAPVCVCASNEHMLVCVCAWCVVCKAGHQLGIDTSAEHKHTRSTLPTQEEVNTPVQNTNPQRQTFA